MLTKISIANFCRSNSKRSHFVSSRVSSRATTRLRLSAQCSSAARTFSWMPPGSSATPTTFTSIYWSAKLPRSEQPNLPSSPPLPARTSLHHSCLGPPFSVHRRTESEHTQSRLNFSKRKNTNDDDVNKQAKNLTKRWKRKDYYT